MQSMPQQMYVKFNMEKHPIPHKLNSTSLLKKISSVNIHKSFVSLELYIGRKTFWKKCASTEHLIFKSHILPSSTIYSPFIKPLTSSKSIAVYILQALHRFILLDECHWKSDSIFPGELYPVLLQLCDALSHYIAIHRSLHTKSIL